MNLDQVKSFLSEPKNRDNGHAKLGKVRATLKEIKAGAVSNNDEEAAKNVWCLEQLLDIQNRYLEAYGLLKNAEHYKAWCKLEECEIKIEFLKPYFSVDDEYFLYLIDKHIEQYQSLYPYKIFSSPEILINEQKCNICGQVVSIRNPCGHEIMKIYNGEMCIREITKPEFLGISLVESPVQKYSVLFPVDEKTGISVDHYNYSILDYLIKRLQSPFDSWEIKWTTKMHPHSRFPNLSRNDKCPCGSGKKYKKCCLDKPGILMPHCQIILSNPSSEEGLGIVMTGYEQTTYLLDQTH